MIALLPWALVLAACATPQERCVNEAQEPYRTTLKNLAVAEGNLARGYAIHVQRVPYTVYGTCFRNTGKRSIPYVCPSTAYRTIETPVPIDVANEQRKIEELRRTIPQYQARATEVIARCNAVYSGQD